VLIVGLMTGTSLDGIDAALVDFEGDRVDELRWKVLHSITLPYPSERREAIHRQVVAGSARGICELHAQLGEWLADAVVEVCRGAGVEVAEVDLIGSHGQTIWHEPPTSGGRGATLQLGCPATIAERTGVPVVADFRSRDVAAGGQGAPLVPWVDQTLFALPDRARALQNIGGIGNVTWLPPRNSGRAAVAFDTGPGNALIDAAVTLATGGRLSFDVDGAFAARGQVDGRLLDDLLRHPFFALEPPRSTGRELFGRPFVERLAQAVRPEGDQDWLDIVATLTELTARSISGAYERWLVPRGIDEIVVTGGGARNPTLVGRLQALLEPTPVLTSEALGIGPNEKEALAFAVLAWAHVHGVPGNLPAATGAAGPRVLGSYTPGVAAKREEVSR
jgi:anhydro-N-acetylmuramic acid kinase